MVLIRRCVLANDFYADPVDEDQDRSASPVVAVDL